MGLLSPLSAALLLLAAAVSPSRASISAWQTGIGPQLLLQNTTTGAIRYSKCNSYSTPAYSYTDESELSLQYKPKAGTPVTGVGWWNEIMTIASIWYMTENNTIANTLVNCNMTTGLFISQGNWVVSPKGLSIHANSSLTSILLGYTGGYRVYYHDANMTINELAYTTDTGWSANGPISQDPQSSPALAAAFTGSVNITVVSARDSQNIEAIRYYSDNSWRVTTLPHPLEGNLTTANTEASSIAINETTPTNFTLASWNGTQVSMGISIDAAYTRMIWYLGSDSNLYSVRNTKYTWGQQTNQSTAFWPVADSPNTGLGVASDFKTSMVRLYYFVGGKLAEIKYENGGWKAWTPVPLPQPVIVQPETPGNPSGAAAVGSGGLSTGAKAGVGVGVTLGIIALGALGAAIFLMRRRKPAAHEALPATFEHPTNVPPYGSAEGQHGPSAYDNYMWEKKNSEQQSPDNQGFHQLDAPIRPTEMDVPRPMYELPAEQYSHELVAEPHRTQSP